MSAETAITRTPPETPEAHTGARHGMTSAWFGPRQRYDGQDSAASLLGKAGHIGSTVALGNEAWLAALDRQWSPVEAWLRGDIAARKASDEALAARIAETVAALPREQRPAAVAAFRAEKRAPRPRRTGGRFGRWTASPIGEDLDETRTAALDAFNDAHDHQPYSDEDDPAPGRHKRTGSFWARILGALSRT